MIQCHILNATSRKLLQFASKIWPNLQTKCIFLPWTFGQGVKICSYVAQVKRMMKRFDDNGDGKLDLEEFQRWFNKREAIETKPKPQTNTHIIAGSWVQRRRRIEGAVGLTLEVDEEALNRARARDGAASPRYRLGDTRSSWLSNKRGANCPQKHLLGGKRLHPFTPLAGLVFIKRPGVGGYDQLL